MMLVELRQCQPSSVWVVVVWISRALDSARLDRHALPCLERLVGQDRARSIGGVVSGRSRESDLKELAWRNDG